MIKLSYTRIDNSSDPKIGRFISSDPYVQAPFSSQSLNRYSYVLNNPVGLVDPSGFGPCAWFSSICGVFRWLSEHGTPCSASCAGGFGSGSGGSYGHDEALLQEYGDAVLAKPGSITAPSLPGSPNPPATPAPSGAAGAQPQGRAQVVNLTAADIWQSTFAGIGNSIADTVVSLGGACSRLGRHIFRVSVVVAPTV